MNLKFMTSWPDHMGPLAGKPTDFIFKIWASLEQFNLVTDEDVELHLGRSGIRPGLLQTYFGKEWIDRYESTVFLPKAHTIRRGRSWKPGMKIHFQIWNGKPYKSDVIQFAPIIECKSIQHIHIESGDIYIDGDQLKLTEHNFDQLQNVALFDGFETLEDFWKYFSHHQPFSGQIIHWHDFKYEV